MSRTKVSIVKAYDYNSPELFSAIEESINLIGGLETIIKPGSKVFVKINHLSPASQAERGIVTHPAFIEAVLEFLKRTGAEITVGDDIDSGDIDGFQVSGIRQMCDRVGIKLINLRETGFVETDCKGHFLKKVYLSSTVLSADVIVNLPKLKTHSLTIFTGGVKNMFGIIPHGRRIRFHGEYIKVQDFTQVLTDIFSTAIPHLTIMDGIIAMEGDGPSSGKLRKIGVVLASRDAVAVDAVATKIIGREPLDIYTTRYSVERGLGVGNLDNIELVGERLENVVIPDFKLPTNAIAIVMRRIPGFLSKSVQGQLAIKMVVIKKQCTLCLECQKTCPAAAITKADGAVKVNHNICIGCMCCYEVCRFNAIKPKRRITVRMISFLSTIPGKARNISS